MKVSIVSIGLDGDKNLTHQAMLALKTADLLLGNKEIIDKIGKYYQCAVVRTLTDKEIKNQIDTHPGVHTAIVYPEDVTYKTDIQPLLDLLVGHEIEIVSGMVTVQYVASKLRKNWHDVAIFTPTESQSSVVGTVLTNKNTLFITGGGMSPQKILMTLYSAGFGSAKAYIASQMGSSEEEITYSTVSYSARQVYHQNTVIWIERKSNFLESYKGSVQDKHLINGDSFIFSYPNSMLRAQIVSSLGRGCDGVFYDIGSGIGSVAIELALANPFAQVYAFESNPQAAQAITDNRKKFGANNLTIVTGRIEQSIGKIPPPTKVYIGDYRGNIKSTMEMIWNKNNNCRVVITTGVVEVLAQIVALFRVNRVPNYSISQVSVVPTELVGGCLEMKPQVPVFFISGGRE